MSTTKENRKAISENSSLANPSQSSNKNSRVGSIKEWLENLENEDKRKIVSALKRSKEAADNPHSSKLKKAKETYGDFEDLLPTLVKSERFGKERFSLEFMPQRAVEKLPQDGWLTPLEAIELANQITVERASYPQRLKLAFIYLARRQGIKNHLSFRYSLDGDNYTKAYPNLDSVPEGEETIGFEEASKIVQDDRKNRIAPHNGEQTDVFQTKVFRVSLSSLESSQIMAFEKCQPEDSPIPRANYRMEVHPSFTYRNLKRNSNFKLLWPLKQENALYCLMDACQDLILQCSSETLGAGAPYYATLYERYAEIGPEGLLYKGLVANGIDKKSVSQRVTEAVENIWTGFSSRAKPIMCLHSKECHWICQLVEEYEG
jgi:hypothetical protein